MKTAKIMQRSLQALIVSLGLMAAPAFAADTGQIGEVFFCTFNEGKGWDDFEKARARYEQALRKIGGSADDMRAFVWRPFRSRNQIDFLWAQYHENLRTMAKGWQEYLASDEGAAADALWDETVKCGSGTTFTEMIYEGPEFPAPADGRVMLESFACNLQPGQTLADLNEAIKIWHQHATDLNLPFNVFQRTKLVMNSEYDHFYFVVHRDAEAYGDNISEWFTHPNTAAVDAMLNQVQSCGSALWQSWMVFDPEG